MAAMPIIPAALIQKWRKNAIPQLVLGSLWAQMSNQFAPTQTLPKASKKPMPNAVVMKVTDEFSDGSYKVTIPAVRKPQTVVVRGPNPAKGRENRARMQQVGAYWQIKRIPYQLKDESVAGDVAKFYDWAEKQTQFIVNDFAEDDDYDHQMATLEGAEEDLWDPAAWEESEKGSDISHPLEKTLHPNFYCWINGKLEKNTWSKTYATALSNLESKLDDMDTADTFNMRLLDAIVVKATRTVVPLGGFQGDRSIRYVLKISDGQWNQLMSDSNSGSVQDRFKYVETGFQKVHSGDMGIYRGVLVVVDQRSPLAKIETSSVTFQYITAGGDQRQPVATNAQANTGTVELAMLYGNGALVQGVKEQLTFKQQQSDDYGFEAGIAGVVKRAVRRTDLDTQEIATDDRINESSFVVATASTGSDY